MNETMNMLTAVMITIALVAGVPGFILGPLLDLEGRWRTVTHSLYAVFGVALLVLVGVGLLSLWLSAFPITQK